MKGVDEEQLGDNDGRALEIDGLPAIVSKIVDFEKFGVK